MQVTVVVNLHKKLKISRIKFCSLPKIMLLSYQKILKKPKPVPEKHVVFNIYLINKVVNPLYPGSDTDDVE